MRTAGQGVRAIAEVQGGQVHPRAQPARRRAVGRAAPLAVRQPIYPAYLAAGRTHPQAPLLYWSRIHRLFGLFINNNQHCIIGKKGKLRARRLTAAPT